MMSSLSQRLKNAAKALPPITSKAFPSYFDWLGDYDLVLLGDGSHGTSEFYSARAEISKRLIKEHGFKMVALEADWPDAEAIDHYVRRWHGHPGLAAPRDVPFKRFPTWMWRNKEMQDFVHWLRDYNEGLPREEKAGVFGLDLYSMGTSMHAVIDYLDAMDKDMAQEARERYGRLQRWVDRTHEYGFKMRRSVLESCEEDVIKMLLSLLKKRLEFSAVIHDGERFFSAEQNATVVVDAEEYYRKMYYSDEITWNLRDLHMFDTLKRLLEFRKSKVIVWAHNSHLGDARETAMGMRRGEINLGQLCREHLEHVAIVGCGTHDGTVAAAHEWDSDMEVMTVNPSRKDSWERVAHDTGLDSFLIDLRERHCDEALRDELAEERLERFIGVIYRPMTERWSHYSAAKLSKQFDAYLFFNTTQAVQALEKAQPATALEEEETYPFGL